MILNGHEPNGVYPGLKMPPRNLECEVGVIGSVVLDNSELAEVCDRLTPEDFHLPAHQAVWRVILAMHAEGSPIDSLTLGDRLQSLGLLDAAGGPDFLMEIVDRTPHSSSAAHYADIVRGKSVARRLIGVHTDGLKEAYGDQFTAEQLLDRAEQRVLSIANTEATGGTVRIDAVMPDVLAAIERRTQGEITGLSSGLGDLDDATTGFQPENLIYLAGRTSMGKTACSLGIADHLAVANGRPVLFVSLEMSRSEVAERLLVTRSGVDGQRVRTGRLSADDRAKLAMADGQIRSSPIFIDDTAGRTASQIVSNARRFHSREQIQIVFIDLINHVEGENRRESRREQIGVISRRFKGLARELKVPVVVLAQLNREVEGRVGNRPRKSDLKECGNLEEDADVVILLHRPEYYDPNDQPGMATLIVDKNRNGPTRDVKVVFEKNLMRFNDLAHQTPDF